MKPPPKLAAATKPKRKRRPAVPKYRRMAEHFRYEIATGALGPGDRLPPFTQVGKRFGMSQHTFEKVHTLLEQDGLIRREPGRGVFVLPPQVATATHVLGAMIHPLVRDSPYYIHLLRGVQDEAQRRNTELLLLNFDTKPQWQSLSGLILMGMGDYGAPKLPEGFPCVSLMQPIPGVRCVIADEAQGITDAMKHLLGLGHRRIAFLGTLSGDSADTRRSAAYVRALRGAGIEPDPAWMRALKTRDDPWTEFTELGALKMKRWLEGGWARLGCTALVAQNDYSAIGAIEALREAGIEVPGQVSVVGFDGLQMGRVYRPSLTTIQVPLEEVGARGVAILLDGPDKAGGRRLATKLAVRLEVRETTGVVAEIFGN